MKKFLVLVAHGSEEIETVTIVDVLRRAGWSVTLASIHPETTVLCSRNVTILADCTLDSISNPLDFDALILPGGGPGTQQFRASATVIQLCRSYAARHKWLGAICAAPLVLQDAGLLTQLQATCYPGMETEFHPGTLSRESVVVADHIITSRGPGTTFDFALAFVELLGSEQEANRLRKALLLS